MRFFFKTVLYLLIPALAEAQPVNIDSLKITYSKTPDGPVKYKVASNIYFYFQETNRDSALFYAEQQALIGKRKNNEIAVGVALAQQSYQLMGLGKYAESLGCLQQAFLIANDTRNEKQEQWDYFFTPFYGNNRLLLLSYTHHMYALLMLNTQNLEQQIIHFKIAGKIGKEIGYAPRIMLAYLNLGQSYLDANKPDSALYYEKEAERIVLQTIDSSARVSMTYLGTVEMHLGDIYKAMKNERMSLFYYHKAVQTSAQINNRTSLSRLCSKLAVYHINEGNKDSSLYYSLKNLAILQTLGQVAGGESNLGSGYQHVYLSYKLNDQWDSAFKYQGLALVTKDSLNSIRVRNLVEFQKLTYAEQLRLQNLEKEKVVYQNKVRTYFLLAGIGVFLLLAIIFYRNNRQKHKAKIRIEQAYDNLKATQQQLIQSEKMASLGELTAGIAHEIQNPLNFVNNFSELNAELLKEMKDEMDIGNLDEAKAIANDVIDNQQKITNHGKRADAIVKGMLQHSRSSTGVKEPTDINALADEYLRLSYHGIRAKDKLFNAILKTDYDASIGNINIIPQDIGRVILNLITNAFYAVNEKTLSAVLDPAYRQAGPTAVKYEPTVTVSTKKVGDKVQVNVKDNGNGIPQKVLDKIFQPFFTTKPTGQGTGLGLSLSYDIVKSHGGELTVETSDGEGSKFVLQLPL